MFRYGVFFCFFLSVPSFCLAQTVKQSGTDIESVSRVFDRGVEAVCKEMAPGIADEACARLAPSKTYSAFAAKHWNRPEDRNDDGLKYEVFNKVIDVAKERITGLSQRRPQVSVIPAKEVCQMPKADLVADCKATVAQFKAKITDRTVQKYLARSARPKKSSASEKADMNNALREACYEKSKILARICGDGFTDEKAIKREFAFDWQDYLDRKELDANMSVAAGVALAFGQMRVGENINCEPRDVEKECLIQTEVEVADKTISSWPVAKRDGTLRQYWTESEGIIFSPVNVKVGGKSAYFKCDLPFSYSYYYMFGNDSRNNFQVMMPQDKEHCRMVLLDKAVEQKGEIAALFGLQEGDLSECIVYPKLATYTGAILKNRCIDLAYFYINTGHKTLKDDKLPSKQKVLGDLAAAAKDQCYGIRKEGVAAALSMNKENEKAVYDKYRAEIDFVRAVSVARRENKQMLLQGAQEYLDFLCDPSKIVELDKVRAKETEKRITTNNKLREEILSEFPHLQVIFDPKYISSLMSEKEPNPKKKDMVYLSALAQSVPAVLQAMERAIKAESCGTKTLLDLPYSEIQEKMGNSKLVQYFLTCSGDCLERIKAVKPGNCWTPAPNS